MIFSKKSLGQNFLIDKNIINKILQLTKITNRHVVEIGPGKGALTEEILKKKPKSLIVIEKDNDLSNFLQQKYFNNKIIKIYNSDILKFDIEKIIKRETIVFGNLPYNISSQILIKFIKFKKWPPNFFDLIFMFQKEVGKKIMGPFNSRDYGRLSIFVNLRLKIIEKFLVSPNCFFPKPNINSMVIHFKPKKMQIKINDISNLEKITNLFFSNKRKMINKAIIKILNSNQISKLGSLNLNSRPSEIKEEIYYKITQLYER